MRPLLDPQNAELSAVLDSLIVENIDVTVREVARRHQTLKNASAFTRSDERMALISSAQQRQTDARCVSVAPITEKNNKLGERLVKSQGEVEQLEQTVRCLAAGHASLIRAVQLAGGMASLERFWKEYKQVADDLHRSGATPAGAKVLQLADATRGAV
jgi:hypothetical protein